MSNYSQPAVERAMKVQEVILRAMSGELTWLQAADILGRSPRSVRRLRWRYEQHGYDGLFDRRLRTPSPKRAPLSEVERVLALFRETYRGFNVRHFHQIAEREHGVGLSYSFVKKALQQAGLVKKHRGRGKHRRRREPKPCFGEMLHIDGSPHRWLELAPEELRLTLIHVLDDATKKLLYAQLWPEETTEAVMTALREVLVLWGIPVSLYSDRAGWAAFTPKAGGPVDKSKKTQFGRALETLGIEHILAYSPQARGRGERFNRTAQGRLVNELRVAGIREVEVANRYIRERFMPDYDSLFTRAPSDPRSAFVAIGTVDVDQILCVQESRTVAKDNTVVFGQIRMQLAKQSGRRSCEGLSVLVRRHLDATHSVHYGPRCLGRFDHQGGPLAEPVSSALGSELHAKAA